MRREAVVAEIERWVGKPLPGFYRHFLLVHEEQIFGQQVSLYTAESVIERNETYQTKEYCPGYITIGDDSGGRAFVISLSDIPRSVFVVGHGDMDPEEFELVANDFDVWVKHGCPYSLDE